MQFIIIDKIFMIDIYDNYPDCNIFLLQSVHITHNQYFWDWN